MKKKRIRLSNEELADIAKQYTRRFDFQKGNRNAYYQALYRGILDEICAHMGPPPVKRAKPVRFSNEELAEIAKQYTRRSDFKEGNRNAYQQALRRGILDEICAHMEPPRSTKKPVHLSNEELADIAKQYTRRIDFQKGDYNAYHQTLRRGILDEICAHMEPPRSTKKPKKPVRFSNEELAEIAKQYTRRYDFSKGNHNAYKQALYRGILDEICAHMGPPSSLTERYLYILKWPDNSAYIGLTCNVNDRYKKHITKGTVKKFIDANPHLGLPTVITLFGPTTESVAKKLENTLIDSFKLKYNIINKVRGGSLGIPIIRWTKINLELAIQDAYTAGIKTQAHLKEYNRPLYATLKERKLLKQYFLPTVEMTDWTPERIDAELQDALAAGIKTQEQLKEYNYPLHWALRRRNLLKQYFPSTVEMTDWTPERIDAELQDALAAGIKTQAHLKEYSYSFFGALKRRNLLKQYFPSSRIPKVNDNAQMFFDFANIS